MRSARRLSKPLTFYEQCPRCDEITARFPDLHPGFDKTAAVAEANRCLYCFDAPCTTACPTHIDVPRFIKKIASDNLEGSAKTILEANVMGESCSRACPVDVLCEGACVFHRYNKQPIAIGRLQRFAMESVAGTGVGLPFTPAPDTGKSVALIGGGPASLACAAELRRHGIRAIIYDDRPLPGGLNTYGVAEYKLTPAVSLREIDRIADLGVEFHLNTTVDAAMLDYLDDQHDAIFIGVGLGAVHRLGLAGEDKYGITDALTFIAHYKSGDVKAISGRVAVIGAGNTAMDAASASVHLGASEVTMVYRRGPEQMSAFHFEYEHAKHEGVHFLFRAKPVGLKGNGKIEALQLEHLEVASDGSLVPIPDSIFELPVDHLLLAIGQSAHTELLGGDGAGPPRLELHRGRIFIDRATGQTSSPNYFAGGDCTNGGREVVDAVADGKRAGLGIAAWLATQPEAPPNSNGGNDGAS
jgi:dihydropyrimidine dehydrogenase (NAD+) subunit PreT